MKYLIVIAFTCISIISFPQTDNDQAHTLNPTTSKLIGGLFSFQGQEALNGVQTTGIIGNTHRFSIPTFQ